MMVIKNQTCDITCRFVLLLVALNLVCVYGLYVSDKSSSGTASIPRQSAIFGMLWLALATVGG